MDRSLTTQTAIQPVQTALNEAAANLAAHANADMSWAHGINMVHLAPGSMQDGDGTDISYYYDDHGDMLGDSQLIFTVAGKMLYAPAKDTALAVQPPNLGQAPYGLDSLPTVIPPGAGISWITDVISQAVGNVNNINNIILLGHTRLGYWEVHGTMLAYSKDTYSAFGHKVGDWVVRFSYNNQLYEIPCSERLGGPLQLPRIASIYPPSISFSTGPGSHGDYGLYFGPVMVGGAKPFTFSYAYLNNDNSWQTFASNVGSISPPGFNGAGVNVFYDDGTVPSLYPGLFHIINGGAGGGFMTLRCTVSNSAGSTTTLVDGKVATFTFTYSHDS